ncbi:SDR family NAD(P)-dependent oxidoreductase [Mycetocola lacteus]|uniref:SDR family NAD(P)-dependent oxidoreductase n=1 Tax=Mycetocola lacteus TaxID=76637 RepID=A0A3L7AR41_9MICO|nr:SDR family NAD(P)-dependent oxidoreductase [Mycetocola lacteus]RLP82959.1 SDR family NAD(P)-dependent oxidoreductase [Mycetocola lacteus]
MRLQGSTVFVAGATSGLGLATARYFAERGANVVVGGRRGDTAREIAATLPSAIGVELDIADLASVEAAVALTLETYGSIDANVNTAGVNNTVPLVDADGRATIRQDNYRSLLTQMIDTNLLGTFTVMSMVAEAMLANTPNAEGERGVIVNTSSAAGVEGSASMTGYAGTKAGIIGLTLPAARDLAGRGIRVNTVIAGGFDTPMLGVSGEVLAAISQGIPNPQRVGRPDEFAALAAHIVENTYLNGESIRLDGGLRLS